MSANRTDVLQILRTMQALLPDEKSWTKGAFARDETLASRSWKVKDVVCFCIDGARKRAAGPDIQGSAAALRELSFSVLFHTDRPLSVFSERVSGGITVLTEFNDATTFDEVRYIIDGTIGRVEKQGLFPQPYQGAIAA